MQSGVAGGPALLPALPSSSSMHANSSNSSGLVAAEGISSSPHHPHAWATAAAAGTPVSPHHISQQQPLPVSTAYITGAGQAATAAAVAPAGALYGSGTSRHVVSVSQRIPVKVEPAKPRGRSGPKSKFSPFIGVSQYKRTGRWEAHIWDSSSSTRGSRASGGSAKSGKGKQLHLGSFLTAAQAARAYDRAALLLRGPHAALNFPLEDYSHDPVLEELSRMSRSDLVLALRKTCDMELEAAALEAFNAKVPAAAAHLLHNITGPQTSDPGSITAAAAAVGGDISSTILTDQQVYGYSDVYGGSLDGSSLAAAAAAVLPVTTAMQFNGLGEVQQQQLLLPAADGALPAFSFPVKAASMQQQQQMWLQQPPSTSAAPAPPPPGSLPEAAGASPSISSGWPQQQQQQQQQQWHTPADDDNSAAAAFSMQQSSSTPPSPFAGSLQHLIIPAPVLQQQQQLGHLLPHLSAPAPLEHSPLVAHQQQQQQPLQAARSTIPAKMVTAGSAPLSSVGYGKTLDNVGQPLHQQHQQLAATATSLFTGSANPLPQHLQDSGLHIHSTPTSWPPQQQQQQQQPVVSASVRLAPTGSALLPTLSGYQQLSGPASGSLSGLQSGQASGPMPGYQQLLRPPSGHQDPVMLYQSGPHSNPATAAPMPLLNTSSVLRAANNSQQPVSRPSTSNTTSTHLLHQQQQQQQQQVQATTTTVTGYMQANVAGFHAASAAAAGRSNPRSWDGASPGLREHSSTSSSGPSNGSSSHTSGSSAQQQPMDTHQHHHNQGSLTGHQRPNSAPQSYNDHSQHLHCLNTQQQQQQQQGGGLTRCSVSGGSSPAGAHKRNSMAMGVGAQEHTATQAAAAGMHKSRPMQQQQQLQHSGNVIRPGAAAAAATVQGQLSQVHLVTPNSTPAPLSNTCRPPVHGGAWVEHNQQQQQQQQQPETLKYTTVPGIPDFHKFWDSRGDDGNSGSHNSVATAATATAPAAGCHAADAAVAAAAAAVAVEDALIDRRSTAGSNTGGSHCSPPSPTFQIGGSSPHSPHQQQQPLSSVAMVKVEHQQDVTNPQPGTDQPRCRSDSTDNLVWSSKPYKPQTEQLGQAGSIKQAAAETAAAAEVLGLRPSATPPGSPPNTAAALVPTGAAAAGSVQQAAAAAVAVAPVDSGRPVNAQQPPIEEAMQAATAAAGIPPIRTISNITLSNLGPSRTVSSLVLAELARLASGSGSGEHDAATSELVLQECQHLLYTQDSLPGLDQLDLLLAANGGLQSSHQGQILAAGGFKEQRQQQCETAYKTAGTALDAEGFATAAAAAAAQSPLSSNMQLTPSSKRGISPAGKDSTGEVDMPAAKRTRSPAPAAESASTAVPRAAATVVPAAPGTTGIEQSLTDTAGVAAAAHSAAKQLNAVPLTVAAAPAAAGTGEAALHSEPLSWWQMMQL